MAAHFQSQHRRDQSRGGPQPAGHVHQLLIRFDNRARRNRLQRHAADRAMSRPGLADLGKHRAGVDRLVRGGEWTSVHGHGFWSIRNVGVSVRRKDEGVAPMLATPRRRGRFTKRPMAELRLDKCRLGSCRCWSDVREPSSWLHGEAPLGRAHARCGARRPIVGLIGTQRSERPCLWDICAPWYEPRKLQGRRFAPVFLSVTPQRILFCLARRYLKGQKDAAP